MEKTGQKANPKNEKGEATIAKEIIDYSFTLPKDTISKLRKVVTNTLTEVELDDEG